MEKEPVENDQSVGNEVPSEADAYDIPTETMDAVDHQWEEARHNLDGYVRQGLGWEYVGKGNAIRMGDLLAKGLQPPPEVLTKLGRMLSPADDYRGPRLFIAVPKKKTFRFSALEMSKKRDARERYKKLRESGWCFESAVKQVRKEYGKSRTWVTEVIKLSDMDFLGQTQKWMGIR